MTTFLRLLADKDKATHLLASCSALRAGENDGRVFQVAPESFRSVPGAPFAYWVSEAVRQTFRKFPAFEGADRTVRQGLATADDFRFVRTWWEPNSFADRWFGLTKGGAFSRFYAAIPAVVNWHDGGAEIKAGICNRYPYLNGNADFVAKNPEFYFRCGLSWPLRGITYSAQAVPEDCVFSVAGKMAFAAEAQLPFWLAIFNSGAFDYLVRLFAGKVGGVQYEAGLIGRIPVAIPDQKLSARLATLSRRAWSLKRTLDTIEETSHAFALPAALRARLGDYDPPAIEAELTRIQAEIDAIAFDLYGFSEADRAAVHARQGSPSEGESETNDDQDEEAGDEEDRADPIDQTSGLISWALGVSFGRFDWRLATSERAAPAEPEPFDPLPAKSPGMLPDGAEPFHAHEGILVDDSGHPHDLARLIEEVLDRVEAPVPEDVRRWLQKDFFPFHLQRYSKSRRKAPIYWPLSTTSGNYTLWVYYPSLTSQTLYTAINDFIEPKLKQVGADVTALRNKGSARSRDDERQFEALQAFELELMELRDTLLKLAPTYKPHHDDGVQISAAPLWPLFRHKPWQKVLKDTWGKLEKGDYDWAHLAMNYWPERVREKCKTDKSLAIAHGMEDLYIEPEAAPKKTRGRKKTGGDE